MNLQKIYEDAYNAEYARRCDKPGSTITLTDGHRDYVEKNFFWCGFNWLKFSGRDRKLKKLLEEQGFRIGDGYPTGKHAYPKEIGNRGNGDYLIQCVAYNAVAKHLTELGYMIWSDSRLD